MQTIASSSIHKGTPSGETLYLGSPHSQTLLRIYDKRAELQAKGRSDWESYGIRWELQLKQERAQVCGQVLAYLEETDWMEFVIGVLRSYVDFRHTIREEADEERYRAPLLGWWQELTDGFRKGRLVIEKDEQSLPKVKRWVKHSVAPMLAVICAQHPDAHITPKHIVEYKSSRSMVGVKPATINREMTCLKKAFNLEKREWEWCRENPVSRVSLEKGANKRDRWLTEDEEARLLAACPSWLRELVVWALHTGMRLGEILVLTWSGVDLFRKTVTVFRSKNGERRTVPLNHP